MKKKLEKNSKEDINTPNRFTPQQTVSAPDSFSSIPLIAGVDWHTNAKIVQKMIDYPELRNKIHGHITHDEMKDQSHDQTNFLGYCNDN